MSKTMGSMAIIVLQSALLVVFFATQTDGACKKINSCKCRLDDGMVVDLKELGKNDGTARFQDLLSTSDYYYYSYNPCYDFTDGTGDCQNVAACQKSSPGVAQRDYDLGNQASASFVTEGNDLFLQYSGSGTADPTQRTSKVKLICSNSGTPDALIAYGESSAGSTTYNFELYSQHCCGKEDTGGGDGGLSAGSILCIIALVLVIVYLIGGVLIMKFVKKETGSDLIPNKGFWVSLPGYIKDGFLFAISPCRKGGRDTYNEI
ncbi:uncharacterized protein [Ptychodera flava]|uniref:uncharacterized protein n=1 Tax=Ptychodera flava TaxID=63121 RepID=UPI00396A5EEB